MAGLVLFRALIAPATGGSSARTTAVACLMFPDGVSETYGLRVRGNICWAVTVVHLSGVGECQVLQVGVGSCERWLGVPGVFVK